MAVDDDTVNIPVIVVEARLAVEDAVNIPIIDELAFKVLAVRLVEVVVARVEVPVTVKMLDTVEVPATREVDVALVAIRLVVVALMAVILVKNADNDLNTSVKKLVEVAADPEALIKD